MSELLRRAGALFVAPAAAAPAWAAAVAPPRVDLAGVLAPADVLVAVAGGVAATLRHAHRARTALVLVPEALAVARPALPAAHALAKRLAARDLPAVAAGATVRVALPGDPEAGGRVAWQAISSAAEIPSVIALSGRSDGYDALLAQADELLLAPPSDEPALTGLALASLATLGPPARLVAPPPGLLTRHLAALGLTRLRPALTAEVTA